MNTARSTTWQVRRMTNTYMRTPFIVTNPACPEGRHPTRDCGCKVFKKEADAQAYAAEMRRTP